jgi:Domain of unknown function (DUF4276)
MKHLVFLLEEPSARDLLEGLLPSLLVPTDVQVHYMIFEGKQDLEANVTRKLRGWIRKEPTAFVILRDQDAAPCLAVKQSLVQLAAASGKPRTLVRVACHELESWLLGDWAAVAEAFDKPRLAEHSRLSLYADPDRLSNPVHELRKYLPEYQKRDGARRVGPLLHPARNRSVSFRVFCEGVQRLVQDL